MMNIERETPQQLGERVAHACRVLGMLDLTHGTLGHVSHRVPGTDTMLIRGKGADETAVRYTTADDIALIDFDANVVHAREGLRAPSESFIHIWLYRLNPEVMSVVHAHSRSSVLLTITGHAVVPIYGNYGYGSKLAIGGVPVYDYPFTVDDDALGEEFAHMVGTGPVALMRGHGVTVVGNSIEEAMVRTIALEELTSMTVDALKIGQPRPLTHDEVQHLESGVDPARIRGTASEALMITGLWRFYCQLADEQNRRAP